MTRISSYGLYKCLHCQQIHLTNLYGSISSYVPSDALLSKEDAFACKSCGLEQRLEEYLFLGMRGKESSYRPNIFEKLALHFKLCSPKQERDLRKVYPYLNL